MRREQNVFWLGVAALAAAIPAVPARAGSVVLNTITAHGYTFTNFDDSPDGTPPVASNANGISNAGQAAVTTFDANGNATFNNFAANPLNGTANQLNTGAGQMVFGINSAGNVVGGNGTTAFYLPNGGSLQTIPVGGAINAFGINDHGNIVGQFNQGDLTPGFFLSSINSVAFTTINQPLGITNDVINAQGVNNNGLVVGFYLGNDDQVHGFKVNAANSSGSITANAISDPVIPTVAGEPANTKFVFSQILGINDGGLAAGYYGDSTLSQHGYFYNTNTGTYTFLDDPSAGFNGNGVEVTQITGISNSGEISGFYSGPDGIFHSFVATAVPEPTSMVLMGIGVASTLAVGAIRRKRSSRWQSGTSAATGWSR
jgi:hypothetical protein